MEALAIISVQYISWYIADFFDFTEAKKKKKKKTVGKFVWSSVHLPISSNQPPRCQNYNMDPLGISNVENNWQASVFMNPLIFFPFSVHELIPSTAIVPSSRNLDIYFPSIRWKVLNSCSIRQQTFLRLVLG